VAKEAGMVNHKINLKNVPSVCGIPGHSDTVITCSCGWTETLRHGETRSRETQQVLLHHRIAALEKLVGIHFEVTYGEPSDE
jgi:hypothetical protein